MEKKYKLLFVCLGNICRSPAAQTVMSRAVEKAGLGDRIECDSAGTYGGHAGEKADARMRRAAARRGYDITHISRPVRSSDFDDADMIIAMDDNNYHTLYRLAPSIEAGDKICRMTDFCRKYAESRYVPDPYYEGAEGFEIVLDMLEDACEGLLDYLKKEVVGHGCPPPSRIL